MLVALDPLYPVAEEPLGLALLGLVVALVPPVPGMAQAPSSREAAAMDVAERAVRDRRSEVMRGLSGTRTYAGRGPASSRPPVSPPR